MNKPERRAARARLDRYEILCEGAQSAPSAGSNLGIPPSRPDGWRSAVDGEISVKVQEGRYVLCSPLKAHAPVPVSSDFVFALGSLLGFFEPFYGGTDAGGSRIIYTRAELLKDTFGPGWTRYAHAVACCDARPGAPLLVDGLPH